MNLELDQQTNCVITVDIALENHKVVNGQDIVFVGAVGKELIAQLRSDGHTVLPITAHQKEGDFLVQVGMQAGRSKNSIWQRHREFVQENIENISVLYTICSGVVQIVRCVIAAYRKYNQDISFQSGNYGQEALKIVVELDGANLTIDVAHFEENEAVYRLAQRFMQEHPTVTQRITRNSRTYVHHQLSRRTRKKHRHG